MVVLDLSEIRRSFPSEPAVHVLKGIDLRIEQGEFVAIEGRSGGGKSTLLNIIGALDIPTSGRYLIDGVDVQGASAKQLATIRSQVFAFVFQSFHLLDRRPVIDSVELGLLYRGVERGERRLRALQALKTLGLEQLAKTRSSKLSGGERQRIALARALASQAPELVADEPTGNLDSENARTVIQTLRQVNELGTTVILVTHSAEVAGAASRRIRLNDGVILETPLEATRPVPWHADPASAAPFGPSPPPSLTKPTGSASGTAMAPSSPLSLRDLARDAGANVLSRMSKTTGLIAAVMLGVGLGVGSLGIAESASSQVSDTFDAHANRDVTVEWQTTDLAAQPEGMRRSIRDRLSQLSGVEAAALLTSHGRTTVQAGVSAPQSAVNGYSSTADVTRAARLSVRWAASFDHRMKDDEVLIGATLAQQIELSPLDLAPQILVNGSTFRVVGLIVDSPRLPELAGSVLVSEGAATQLSESERVRALLLSSAGAAQQVARQAPLVVDPFSSTSLQVSAPIDPRTLRSDIESDLGVTLLALTALALTAATIGLANAMMLAVVERRHEFGLRRAVGARPKQVFALIISEAAFVGLVGGVGGLVAGLGGVLVVTIGRHWIPVFDLRLAPLAVLGGMAIGSLAGIVAAAKASRVLPSEALRH